MTTAEIIRLVWLIAASMAAGICMMTLRLAYLDYQATERLPVPNGRRLVARILVRDEALTLFVQLGFIGVVMSVWLAPEAIILRSLLFIVISLTLGVASACRWHDRSMFWHNGHVRHDDLIEEEETEI